MTITHYLNPLLSSSAFLKKDNFSNLTCCPHLQLLLNTKPCLYWMNRPHPIIMITQPDLLFQNNPYVDTDIIKTNWHIGLHGWDPMLNFRFTATLSLIGLFLLEFQTQFSQRCQCSWWDHSWQPRGAGNAGAQEKGGCSEAQGDPVQDRTIWDHSVCLFLPHFQRCLLGGFAT